MDTELLQLIMISIAVPGTYLVGLVITGIAYDKGW